MSNEDKGRRQSGGQLVVPGGGMIFNRTGTDLAGVEGKTAIYNLMVGPATSVEEVLSVPLSVTGYLTHIAEGVDEDSGEIKTWLRTVLLTDGGTRVSVGSEVILRRLQDYEKYCRPAPWQPPITIRIVPVRGKRKRTYYTMEVITNGEQPPAE